MEKGNQHYYDMILAFIESHKMIADSDYADGWNEGIKFVTERLNKIFFKAISVNEEINKNESSTN